MHVNSRVRLVVDFVSRPPPQVSFRTLVYTIQVLFLPLSLYIPFRDHVAFLRVHCYTYISQQVETITINLRQNNSHTHTQRGIVLCTALYPLLFTMKFLVANNSQELYNNSILKKLQFNHDYKSESINLRIDIALDTTAYTHIYKLKLKARTFNRYLYYI